MLDPNQHKAILIKILKEIYTHPVLRIAIGFKGGTSAFIFYNLPRLSVDLDFDLLDETKKSEVFTSLAKILPKFGSVTDATDKRFTIFFLLNYQKGERNIKIEISKRKTISEFEVKHYLGIPILTMKQKDITANKLSALIGRKKLASRDLFDLWFFLNNDWRINESIVKEKTGLTLNKALYQAIQKVAKVRSDLLLQGIGEMINTKQKTWVKTHLKNELLFQLKLYQETNQKT